MILISFIHQQKNTSSSFIHERLLQKKINVGNNPRELPIQTLIRKKGTKPHTYTHQSTCIYRLSSSIPFPCNILLLYVQGIIITFDNQNQVVIKWRDLDAVALWHVAVILLEFDVERPTSWVRDLYLKLLSHLDFLVLDVFLEFRWVWRKRKWMIKRANFWGIVQYM